MGFVCSVILEAKKILQKLWQFNLELGSISKQRLVIEPNLGWDDEIPWDLQNHWNKWKSELSALSQVQGPRCHLVHGAVRDISFRLILDAVLKMAIAYVPILDLFTLVEL